ncbi:cytochrome P450 [Pseudonocardia sp. TRM90224]|uniref:cytochrome P450 n=1 Tax=Pseudonocardia sp. TRM90224 TaxID=2812678 RepID=UPI001E372FA9|nr:cytochrome P450 [Pseudonocardia sp. TRM90224]
MVDSATISTPIPQAPGGIPVLGHVLPLLRNPLDFLASLPDHGDVVQMRVGTLRLVVVCDPGLTRHVLKDLQTFDKGGPIIARIEEVLGESSVGTCPHSAHRRLRTLVQPAFHRERLPAYARVMTANFLDLGWHDGQVVDVPAEMGIRTVHTLVETMFSDKLSPETTARVLDETATALREIYRRAVRPPVLDRLPLPGNRAFDRAGVGIRGVLGDVLAARRASGADPDDLLSALLTARLPGAEGAPARAGDALSESEIGDQLITFLTGGTESSASTLAWAFHQLGQHPDIRTRLYEELDTVLAGGPATFEHLPQLRLTANIITEALRLYPPAWVLSRTVVADTELGGHPVRAGSMIIFSPYIIHRRPDLYPDPDTFAPDRWADGTVSGRSYFLPFGGGVRKCIGDQFALTEMVLGLANIAARWHLEPVPGATPGVQIGVSLHPRNLMMRVTARHHPPTTSE